MEPRLFSEHDVSDRVIIENEFAFAFPTNSPIVPGHVLICPKRRVERYEELNNNEKTAIEELRVCLKAALESVFEAQGFNYAWNENKIGGQSVPHFHLLIVPRKEGDVGIYHYEPREFLYRPGTCAKSPDQELRDVASTIKAAL